LAHYPKPGAGDIWNGNPFEALVIPAEAGIHSAHQWEYFAEVARASCPCGVMAMMAMPPGRDSRLRGNDGAGELILQPSPPWGRGRRLRAAGWGGSQP